MAAALLATVCTVLAEAPVKVDGLGWLHNHDMRQSLGRLMSVGPNGLLDANSIEDGAVILNSAMNEQGYQRPTIDVVATLADGAVRTFRFDPTFANSLPRPLEARSVEYRIAHGVRWRISRVLVNGLTVFPKDEGMTYFKTDATLLNVAMANAYSKSRVNRSEDALLDELRRRGHAEASVRAEIAAVDERTGAVTLRVDVQEGPRWRVDHVRFVGAAMEGVTLPDAHRWEGTTWNPTLEQVIREAVRLAFYGGGHPDVALQVSVDPAETVSGQRSTTLTVTVVPGPLVKAGEARFVGNEKTREPVLRRRVTVKPGDLLNPVDLEHSRYRISRLGIFLSVDLRYDPPNGPVRDPVFVLKEAPDYETNLLFGYGSYEQFRAGVEYRQMNILGLAHQSRLLAVESMKSTRLEYTYNVPELFGETIDGSAKLFGLERQEIAFQRQEYGATFGLRRAVPGIHGEASAGYTFQALRNRKNALSTLATDEKQLNVASLTFGLSTDRRDNALRPRSGYHANAEVEVASPYLGGVAHYQRFELTGAYHTPWGRGRWVHVGFSHGLITTLSARNDHELPVNKRFYPGGDNSIRGYQTGEAAPRDASGRFVGAKTYALLNLELEQALTQGWTIVAFGDGLAASARLGDYPLGERLYSVGLGVRYQTIVGPVRLEYGRNINPRPADPPGTWQISLGYPF